jgi:internalin A
VNSPARPIRPRRRAAWRLRTPTWIVLILLSGLLVLANWPMTYVDQRASQGGYAFEGYSGPTLKSIEMLDCRYAGLPWRWYFSSRSRAAVALPPSERIVRWSLRPLSANVAVAAIALALAGLWCEWRCRRGRGWLQFTLGDILVLTFVAALPLAWWRYEQTRWQQQRAFLDDECVASYETSLRYPVWLGKLLPVERLNLLTTVSQLYLSRPTPEGLRKLACFPELETLVLDVGFYRADDLAVLGRFPFLRSLKVSGNEANCTAVFAQLAQLQNLRTLDLRDLSVRDEHLARFPILRNLRILNLADTEITDQGLKHVTRLPLLQTLVLPADRLTGAGLIHLHGHPALTMLELGSGPRDSGREDAPVRLRNVHLRDLPSLTQLSLPERLDRLELHNLPSLRGLPTGHPDFSEWFFPPTRRFIGRRAELGFIPASIRRVARMGRPRRVDAQSVRFSDLPALQSLELCGQRLRQLELDSVPNLTSLTLTPRASYDPYYRRVVEYQRMKIDRDILRPIGRIASLRALVITGADVDDADFAVLSDLKQLHSLSLQGSHAGDVAMASLAGNRGLRRLDLRNTRVTDAGWSRLMPLAELQELDISHTGITRLHLQSLKGLVVIQLQGLALQDLHLEDLPELQGILVLNHTPLRHVRLVDLPKLADLSLRGCGKTGRAPSRFHDNAEDLVDHEVPVPVFSQPSQGTTPANFELSGLTSLETLDLCDSSADNGLLASLADYQNLSFLNLSGSDVTDDAMAVVGGFAQLRSLDLEDTCVSDVGLAHLARLQNLTRLNLTGTVVTDDALRFLAENQGLELLYLGRTQVRGDFLEHVAKLPGLIKLSLGETGVTSQSLAELSRLRNLVWLRLSHTHIDDRGLETVGNLPQLRTLLINGCAVTDDGLKALDGLPNLAELDLDDTRVTDSGRNRMRQRGVRLVP